MPFVILIMDFWNVKSHEINSGIEHSMCNKYHMSEKKRLHLTRKHALHRQ